MIRLDVEGGKYTIECGTVGDRYVFRALRCGEPWVDFAGPDGYAATKMWIAVVHELDELRNREPLFMDALRRVLVRSEALAKDAEQDSYEALLAAADEYCSPVGPSERQRAGAAIERWERIEAAAAAMCAALDASDGFALKKAADDLRASVTTRGV